MNEWWTTVQGAYLGAIGGSAVGVLGGCLGAAAGVLAPRGKGKAVVLGSMGTLAMIGFVALIAGIVALVQKQPYHVWYPLVLGGVILNLVMGGLIPVVAMRYRQAEARRMDAEGLRRS